MGGSCSGTVELFAAANYSSILLPVNVGLILKNPHGDMALPRHEPRQLPRGVELRPLESSGSTLRSSWWFYNTGGQICQGSINKGIAISQKVLQYGLHRIRKDDPDRQVTVTVRNNQLTFLVNGVAQGAPIVLPADTEVTMAVSLCYNDDTVRFF